MNLTDLQAYASLLGVPVWIVIITCVLYVFVVRPIVTWIRTDVIPRWLVAQEKQAEAMREIAELVKSLQWEVRESRRVSDANAVRLGEMDEKIDRAIGRPVNSRTRGGS